MDWFRMYGEFAADPKVQSMPEAMQRRLVMLFCLRCSNALVTLQDDEIAFALRISEEELAATKALFIRKGFITDDWEIANWEKRQFASDSSAARVAAHRARKKEQEQQGGNVTVTPQNRTDTEQKQNRGEKAGSAEPQGDSTPEVVLMPLAGGKEFTIRQSHVDEWQAAYPAVDVVRQLAAMRQWCLANPANRKTAKGVLSFCNRWLCKEQDRPRPAARASPGGSGAWWATDQSVIAKGAEMGMAPRAGEGMPAFKGRVQAAIDNGGSEPQPPRSAVGIVAPDDGPRRMKPEGIAPLASLVKSRTVA